MSGDMPVNNSPGAYTDDVFAGEKFRAETQHRAVYSAFAGRAILYRPRFRVAKCENSKNDASSMFVEPSTPFVKSVHVPFFSNFGSYDVSLRSLSRRVGCSRWYAGAPEMMAKLHVYIANIMECVYYVCSLCEYSYL